MEYCRELCNRMNGGEICMETCLVHQIYSDEANTTRFLWESVCRVECEDHPDGEGFCFEYCMENYPEVEEKWVNYS